MHASNNFRSTAQSLHDRPFQSSHTADCNIDFISSRTVSSDTGDEIAIFPVEMRTSDCCLQLPTGEMCQRLPILLQTIRQDLLPTGQEPFNNDVFIGRIHEERSRVFAGVKVVIDQR